MSTAGLTEPAFFILTALVDGPRHGYGIVGEVDRLSGGRMALKVGTLYGVLDRLVADDLVALDREEVANGRLRRYFRLSERGRHRLADEAQRLATNARIAGRRLAATRPARAGGTP